MISHEIINLMHKACDKNRISAWHNGYWIIAQNELERFAALIAASEREQCANIADQHSAPLVAAKIRAGGDQ